MANNLNAIGVANPITVSVGGTGASTLTDHGVLVGSGTGVIDALSVGTNGQVLVGSTGADPVFATISSSNSSITVTAGAGTLGLTTTAASSSQVGGVALASAAEAIAGSDNTKAITPSTLGSKLGTQTNHGVLVGAGTTAAVTALAVGSTGTLLVGSTGADPAFGTSATGDFTFTSTTAGATRTLTVSNTNNSNTASHALIQTTTGGASAGDPFHTYTVTGATSFSQGIDNSASDAFKLSASTALGTTDTWIMTTAGECTMPLQPAFAVYMAAGVNNVTGAGTSYRIGSTGGSTWTEVMDQNNDFDNSTAAIFTAPVTGNYQFNWAIRMSGLTTAMTNATATLSMTSLSYVAGSVNIGATKNVSDTYGISGSAFTRMTAGDTAGLFIQITNGAGDTADVVGGATASTYLNGYLVC